jgi:prolyl oligopeptidase
MAPTAQLPPQTLIEPVTDILHGVPVTDPYRWLEDQNSPRTRKWLEEQAAYTRAYFDAIPGRDSIRRRVSELLQTSSISDPWNVGERFFYLKRYKHAEQPVIVMAKGIRGEETVLVDPDSRSNGHSVAVSIVDVSPDAKFMAYSVRNGGTDHSAIEFLDLERNKVLPDILEEGFCRGLAFAPDGSGFYYSHRKVHDPHPNYQAAFLHRFGTERAEDREVFFAGERPNAFLSIRYSAEAKLLAYVVFSAGKQRRTSLYLHRPWIEDPPVALVVNIEGLFVPFFARGQLLAYTDLGASNLRIVRIDPSQPNSANWSDIVPECERRIQQFAVADDKVFVTRTDRFSTRIEGFGLDGTGGEDVLTFCCGSVSLLNRTIRTDKLIYTRTSVSEPLATCCYDARTKDVSVWEKTEVPFDPSTISFEETTCRSKDGTAIPVFLAARKELLRQGPLPTLLTGYGGFGTCVTPRFSAFATFLIEQGFLLAVPAIRGGGELGEQWHLEGKRQNRQNAFDDFAATAEWLGAEGLSKPDCIAIGGGSNGGLLVGAAITQRPDLFRAAICLGPLLDLTRYHLFDCGAMWTDEYGSPEDEDDFRALFAYSPYHRVQDGVNYPATMFISGNADTRCNPLHARKMVARLQSTRRSRYPILLDHKSTWGHTPVQPVSTRIESLTDRLAFICRELCISTSRTNQTLTGPLAVQSVESVVQEKRGSS